MPTKEEIKAVMAEWGKEGGVARAKILSNKRRSEIARTAAKARWAKWRKEKKA